MSEPMFIKRFGITRLAWRVLAALNVKDGQSISALAASTSLEVSTISRLVDSLETDKFVEKRREKPNMRTVTVHLRAAGARRFAETQLSTIKMGDVLTSGLTANELKYTISGLQKIYANIDAAESFVAGVVEQGEKRKAQGTKR